MGLTKPLMMAPCGPGHRQLFRSAVNDGRAGRVWVSIRRDDVISKRSVLIEGRRKAEKRSPRLAPRASKICREHGIKLSALGTCLVRQWKIGTPRRQRHAHLFRHRTRWVQVDHPSLWFHAAALSQALTRRAG